MRNYLIVFIFIIPVFFSCANTKKIMYFANVKDSSLFKEIEPPEYVIQRNDILSITVSSIDNVASEMFNMTNRSDMVKSTSNIDILQTTGYIVNSDGDIRFLVLGLIRAEGLTKEKLAENIRKLIADRKLLVDPVIEVRHLNFKVTVLGEVNRPTSINVPDERITLLQALGQAGDLTIYANRRNVLVIRTEGGNRIAKRIDLNSNNLLNSPYYNLQPNDVVYAESNQAKILNTKYSTQLFPVIVTSLYALVAILSLLSRK